MWWFAALHANLLLLCRHFVPGIAAHPLLDAGCGTGGLLVRFSTAMPQHTLIGIDTDRFACERAAAKSGCPVCAGSVNALPFADRTFGAIVSADVLCHGGVDETAALAEFHRVLRERGVLILNLPAYDWLMSAHDRAVANTRRYDRRRIARLLDAAGFQVLLATHWNTVLFPLMVLTRKLSRSGAGATSDVKTYPPLIEALCRAATGLERVLLRRGWRLPFGGSVLAVAAKQSKPGDAHA